MIDNNKDDPEWSDAQAIWAAGNINIPAERDAECNHFLSDLKLAAAMFKEAKRVTAVIQEREWSLDDGARLCSDLLNFLYQVDDVEIRTFRPLSACDGKHEQRCPPLSNYVNNV